MKKELPIGVENFRDLIRGDFYYVDKTSFIKPVMESGSKVLLMTRPRRFGKTLFMDTLKNFLQLNPEKPGDQTKEAALFSGLAVANDIDFCRNFMSQFPVVFLSLKTGSGTTFEAAYRAFARNLVNVAKQNAFLADSPRLTEADRTIFRRYLDLDYMRDLAHQDDVQAFLRDLVVFLCRHFGRQVVLLIDEYDVPLAKAAEMGYYDAMLPLVRDFLEEALKPNPDTGYDAEAYLYKGVLTGCLRVSKESIFTGLNNPDINTVCSEDTALSEAVGFTPEETQTMLQYYGLASRADDVRKWYDGYRFAQSDIYCPWDVINFCSKAASSADPLTYRPGNYWDGTGNTRPIQTFLSFLSSDDADRMQALMDGESIPLKVNEQLTYSDFKEHRSADFWTLLLFSGYLTVEKVLPELNTYCVRIPNEEIRDCFKKNIESLYSKENGGAYVHYGADLARAAVAGDAEGLRRILLPLLRKYVSVRDDASRSPAENYYHGFLSALLACAGDAAMNVRSNPEAGTGYADLVFTSPDMETGVVFEVKRCSEPEKMRAEARRALEQIREKRYGTFFDGYGCTRVYGYGIAFSKKACVVAVETILPTTEEP